MNKYRFIIMFLLSGNLLVAQQSISLEICYQKAIDHYPLTLQKEINSASLEASIQKLNKNNLPQLNLNSQVSYQSDVTKIPIQGLPGVEELSKDWYKINLDLNQMLYDGGSTARQKAVEEADYAINQQNLEVQWFGLKNKINQLFFSAILLEQNLKVLATHKESLQARLSDVESGIRNGTILASNADILKAELIQLEQSTDEVKISRDAICSILSEYTGLTIDEQTIFEIPQAEPDLSIFTNNRPEITLMSLQQQKIVATKKLTGSQNLPRLMAFGQLGYGRPGFDMLNNNFTDYYIFGARLSWSFWDWNKTKKQKEILNLKSEIIETQKETFNQQVRVEIKNKLADINKLEKMINRDKQIIELRENIVASAASQLDNGIITSTAYVTELNAASKAKLDMEAHRIELVQAKVDYMAVLGNF